MTVTTYDLGVSGTNFTGAANREDLLDVITIISPTDAPLFTMFRKAKVNNVQVEFLTDVLDQAGSLAVAEGSSATFTAPDARTRLLNYCEIDRVAYDVSDTQRAVNPAGIRDELRFQMGKALKMLKRGIEHNIVNGNTASAASTRCARGMYRWINGFSSVTATAVSTSANLQEDDLNGRLMAIWVAGGLPDYVVCTPTQKKTISTNFAGSANSRRTRPATDNAVTNVVDFYDSDFGNVKILPHRWFNSAAPTTTNIQRVTFAIQSDKWVIGFLRPPKNTPLAKIGSSERAMVEAEWTLLCLHPSANSFVSGHTSGNAFTDNFPLN